MSCVFSIMSLNRVVNPVFLSCRQPSNLLKWSPNYQISRLQQTTKFSTLRIQHTCITVRSTVSVVRTFHITSSHRDRIKPYQQSKPSAVKQHQTNEHRASETLKSWTWFFNVNSFGKICFKRTPFDVIVKPVSPLEYPAADKAFVSLMIKSDTELDADLLESVASSIEANVEYTGDKLLVEGHFNANSQTTESDVESKLKDQGVLVLWQAEVPISFDADIQTSNHGAVMLERLENHNCVVSAEHGNCHINKVKSGDIKVSTLTGDVISKHLLQGNATISTGGSGSISTGRLQGQAISLSTEAGGISCNDIYAVEASLKTTSGNVELDNIHAGCDISSTDGSVNIGSLEGSVKAMTDTGNISAYLVRHKKADLSTQTGDISLQVPGEVKTKYHLEAASVTVTSELHTESMESPTSSNQVLSGDWNDGDDNQLKACTKKGSITVAVQSWFDSLKLNK